MEDIKNYTLDELKNIFTSKGLPKFLAAQIFSWIYKKRAEDFDLMTDISKPSRKYLNESFRFSKLPLARRELSKDGTEKFLFELPDSSYIETVLIPDKNRRTLCLSSQVGCKFGCKFCISGKAGFKRDLAVFEIVSQYLEISKIAKGAKITNVVFMGIGEPLDNFSNVINAVKIFTEKSGIAIAHRKISISTCGLIPQLKDLAKMDLGIKISISLHSADSDMRSELMPVNKKHPLRELKEVMRNFKDKRYPVSFEYCMIKDFNISKDDALKLAKLTKGLKYKLNLIPYNSSSLPLASPDDRQAKIFTEELKKRKVFFTLRKSRGQDIKAACGKLRATWM